MVVCNSGSFSLRLVDVLILQVCFRKLATFGNFFVKGTLIVEAHLHAARVKDVELHLGQAAIIRVSRAMKQTLFHLL